MTPVRLAVCLILLPALASAQAHCAVPTSYEEPGIKLPPVVNPVRPYEPSAVSSSIDDTSAGTQKAGSKPQAVKAAVIPVLAHIRDAGSDLEALGSQHGMAIYAAHSADHFMVFNVTPDEQAILSGLEMQVSLAKLLSMSGSRIQEIGTAHGLRTFFLKSGEHFQVFYATPDEQRVIPGLMWDASGKNLTRQQIAGIPGTRPIVQIANSPSTNIPSKPLDLLDRVRTAYAGTYGRDGAPHAWMFIDPQCSFSVRALQALQPALDAGSIQLSVIPLSILDAEDHGLSTAHALMMVGQASERMVSAWKSGALDGTPSAGAAAKLQQNMDLASLISLRGTPTFLWESQDGSLGRLDGVPTDVAAFIKSIRS